MRYRNFIFDSSRWGAFEHRAGDIIISTPPKCGTTWLQNIVAMLVLGTTDFDRPMANLSPWLDQNLRPLDSVLGGLESQEHHRFIKRATRRSTGSPGTTTSPTWPSAGTRGTSLCRGTTTGTTWTSSGVRPPRSGRRPSARPAASSSSSSTWRRSGSGASNRTWSWSTTPTSADLAGEMRRLAKRLGVTVDETRWPALVAAASFDSMRARAEALAPNAGQIWKDTGAFFHRGRSGQWRDLIDDDGRYDRVVRELTDDEEFLSWLHRP